MRCYLSRGVVCKVHGAISYVVTLFEVTMVRWRRCAISYVVTLFKVTGVRCKTLEGVRAKRKRPKPPRACSGLSLVLVVDSASVLSATCVDPCTVCYGILDLPQRVGVRSDANHCARFIVSCSHEPSATEYPFTIT